jgi:putative SOS response-associated peptidase YedK
MPLFCSVAPQHPIITGEPNELVAQIHPRMPVILPEQHHAAWLGETDNGNLKALLVPYPADQMRMWEISPRVNSPKNDDPSGAAHFYGAMCCQMSNAPVAV